MNEKTPSFTLIFRIFFLSGLTGFGGLAMTAQLRRKIVEKLQWLDESTFDSGLALCQLIPGAIIMQLTAFIGLKLRGIRGAVVSFIAFGLPSFLIMFVLSVLYKHSRNIAGVETILADLRVIIVSIVAYSAWVFGRKIIRNFTNGFLVLFAAGAFYCKLHPVLVILLTILGQFLLQKKTDNGVYNPIKTNTFRFFIRIAISVIAGTAVLFFVSYKYFLLATVMLRIDLFSFGGGLASIPIMYHELVDLFQWFDKQTFMDGIILGQITPGSIIISATFFGYMHLGVPGSILATVCVFIPSFVILMGIGPFFDKLITKNYFRSVINGILCSFVGLLLIITFRFGLDVHWNIFNTASAVIVFVVLMLKADVIWVVLGAVLIFVLKFKIV